MDNETKKNEEVLEKKLRKQLAVAVRSIQWSYAIFWSLSTKEQGVLEWNEGCYNGDIKTRKTVQSCIDLKADKTGLERSEQLRELYKSLLKDETDQQAQRTSSLSSSSSSSSSSSQSLSPEDLTDEEWYYLVCMSFVFNHGQGLPGQALADMKIIWLCDAQHADSKVFCRSLLAKSASIQTVVCFPHLGGVIEIGVTDLVPEDLNLLQHVKASLLDFSKPVCEYKSSHRTVHDNSDKDEEMYAKVDHELVSSFDQENIRDNNDEPNPKPNHEKCDIDSGSDHNHQIEDSKSKSWESSDSDLSIDAKHSLMTASDRKSEAFGNKRNHLSSPTLVNLQRSHLREIQRFDNTKISPLNIGADDDLHYKRALTAVLGGSSKFVKRLSYEYGHDSSFVAWKKERESDYRPPRSQQKLLKQILFTVPLMSYYSSSLEPPNKGFGRNFQGKNLSSDLVGNYSKYESSREEENFHVLKSIIPSINKSDKETVLSDTIKYLKELEARIGELECCTASVNHSARTRKKSLESVEQTSDNRDKSQTRNEKKTWINKRKASDIDENDPDHQDMVSHSLELKVRVKDQEVLIDMKCPYKEYILLEIMDAINHLHLDSHSVQSSTLDGVFTLTLKSKFRGTSIAPIGMIKQALWKVVGNC